MINTKDVYLLLGSITVLSILGNAARGNFSGCLVSFAVMIVLAIIGAIYREVL